jgi:hypothetical protein
LLFELPDLSPTGNRAAAVAGLLFALGLCEPARPEGAERRKMPLRRDRG